MLLKTSLLSAVVGLLGRSEENGARASKGNDQLLFLCNTDVLTLPFPRQCCGLVCYWLSHLFPEEKPGLKETEKNTGLKAAEKDHCLFA